MVRIGALPTRLLSLQYGADLVWSPEIVDRAIIGCDRTVNEKTGLVAYSREGKHIFTTHPIERDRLIFQLGSSSPEWAYKAIKFITAHDEVAGVDLNCGCPKSFSTIGGMGAQLLSTPDLLCDILRAMRIAAPSHVSVTCKIRLLPTKEETQNLVRKIVRTNCIDALTLHCRTKTMRPREPALPHRLQEVKEIVDQESGGKLPLICNGDAWDAAEARSLMQKTGVSAVMMARGPEGNPSCFRPEGVLSVPEIIAPEWVKLAIALDNQYGNTKYC
ncbi:FMN-linked oxidoreductase, partial [Meira miltonrushii]